MTAGIINVPNKKQKDKTAAENLFAALIFTVAYFSLYRFIIIAMPFPVQKVMNNVSKALAYTFLYMLCICRILFNLMYPLNLGTAGK